MANGCLEVVSVWSCLIDGLLRGASGETLPPCAQVAACLVTARSAMAHPVPLSSEATTRLLAPVEVLYLSRLRFVQLRLACLSR
ncbi:hypothetical protein Pfo_011431 [Paulownia fortunei]|nr:hypothetical protein Pfo_011431 [Paulownia fortunei]